MQFYDISPETIQEAQAGGDRSLIPADDARVDTRDPKALRWTEDVTVEKCRAEEVEWNDGKWQRFSIQLRIGAEGSGKNINRVVFGDHQMHITDYLTKQGDIDIDKGTVKRSKYSMSLLTRLLQACEYQWERSKGIPAYMLQEAFGENSPIVGRKMWVEVKQSPRRTKDDSGNLIIHPEGGKRDEVTRYMRYE